MTSTDANDDDAYSDPRRPFLRHRRRRRSPRRIPRGIDSTIVLVLLISVAAFASCRHLRLVGAVVELSTTLGGFRAGVPSTPAMFGKPFAPGRTYDSYMFLPPGDDSDKFLCEVPLRRRRLRNGGNQRMSRNAMEEAAGVLYRAVTGRNPPDASSVATDASLSLGDDEEGRRRRLRSLNDSVEDGGGGGVNATGNATQTNATTATVIGGNVTNNGGNVTNNGGNVTNNGGNDTNNNEADGPDQDLPSYPPAAPQFPADLPLALLVSRGGSETCTFELKARNAMALNDIFRTYVYQGEYPSIAIEVLVVHDHLDAYADEPDRLVQMAGPGDEDDIDLRLVFVSSRSGAILRKILKEDSATRYAKAYGNWDFSPTYGDETQLAYLSGADFVPFSRRGESTWGVPPPPVAKVDGLNAMPPSSEWPHGPQGGDYRPSDRSSSSNGSGAQFLWIRYVLFAVLIVAPIVRGMMLWFEAGGRIKFRRNPDTNRIVGLRLVPAEPGWVRGAAWRDLRAGMGGGGGQQGGVDEHKMSPEEVMALPEIEYQGGAESNSSDGGNVESIGNGDSDGKVQNAVVDDEDTASMDDTGRSSILSSGESDLTATAKGTAADDDDDDDKEQTREEEELSSTTTCTMCSICIDDFERGEKIRLLPRCRHAFHTDCILPWLTERQGRCPLCKKRVLVEENDEDEDEEREEGEDIIVGSSDHEERAVELTRISQVNAHDDSSASSGVLVEASAGDAESGENDQILRSDTTDNSVGGASRHEVDEESGTDGGTESHSAARAESTDRQ